MSPRAIVYSGTAFIVVSSAVLGNVVGGNASWFALGLTLGFLAGFTTLAAAVVRDRERNRR